MDKQGHACQLDQWTRGANINESAVVDHNHILVGLSDRVNVDDKPMDSR